MREPGLDRHDWESEWASLEPDLEDSPREALPAIGDLVERMVRERGIPVGEPVGEGGVERASRQPSGARRSLIESSGPRTSTLGDVAAAVNLYREVYDHVLAELRDCTGYGPRAIARRLLFYARFRRAQPPPRGEPTGRKRACGSRLCQISR